MSRTNRSASIARPTPVAYTPRVNVCPRTHGTRRAVLIRLTLVACRKARLQAVRHTGGTRATQLRRSERKLAVTHWSAIVARGARAMSSTYAVRRSVEAGARKALWACVALDTFRAVVTLEVRCTLCASGWRKPRVTLARRRAEYGRVARPVAVAEGSTWGTPQQSARAPIQSHSQQPNGEPLGTPRCPHRDRHLVITTHRHARNVPIRP